MDQQAERRRKNYILRRSVIDYGMGIVILGFGVFILFAERFGFKVNVDNVMRYLFVGLCALYGGFRIYRGASKQYFREED